MENKIYKSKSSSSNKKTSSKNKTQVRVHKIIADSGLCSRRNAETLITSGRVKVNGEYVEIGQSANPKTDKITVDDQPLEQQKKRYIMMHKPFSYHTTTKDPYTQNTVISILEKAGIKERLYPVGRLDKNASGLLLLTNDGDWANNVIHPSVGFEKEYHAKTNKALSTDQMNKIKKGIMLDDGPVQARIKPVSRGFYSLTLKAGRHKIVKRIFKYFDVHVTGLKRVRIGPYKLGTLKIGDIKEIKPATINQTVDGTKHNHKTHFSDIKNRFKREKDRLKTREMDRIVKKPKRAHLNKVSPKIDRDYTKRRRDRERGVTTAREPRAPRHSRGARFESENKEYTTRDKRYSVEPTRAPRERRPARGFKALNKDSHSSTSPRRAAGSVRDQLNDFKKSFGRSDRSPTRRNSPSHGFNRSDDRPAYSRDRQSRGFSRDSPARSSRRSNDSPRKSYSNRGSSSSGFTPFDKNKPIKSADFRESKRDNSDRVPRKKRAPVDRVYDQEPSGHSKDPKRLHVAKASKPFDLKKMLRKVGKKKDPMKAKKGAKKRWA